MTSSIVNLEHIASSDIPHLSPGQHQIDDLKEKLKLLKKEIDAKDKLIKAKNDEMEVLKKEHESETKKQESEYFKEIEGIKMIFM